MMGLGPTEGSESSRSLCIVDIKVNFSCRAAAISVYCAPGNDARLIFSSLHKRGLRQGSALWKRRKLLGAELLSQVIGLGNS